MVTSLLDKKDTKMPFKMDALQSSLLCVDTTLVHSFNCVTFLSLNDSYLSVNWVNKQKTHSSEKGRVLGRDCKQKNVKIQRKKVKYLQNNWRTIAQDPFNRLEECLAHWKQNMEK